MIGEVSVGTKKERDVALTRARREISKGGERNKDTRAVPLALTRDGGGCGVCASHVLRINNTIFCLVLVFSAQEESSKTVHAVRTIAYSLTSKLGGLQPG